MRSVFVPASASLLALVVASVGFAGPPQTVDGRGRSGAHLSDRAREALQSRSILDRLQDAGGPAVVGGSRRVDPANVGRRSLGPQSGSGHVEQALDISRGRLGRGRELANRIRQQPDRPGNAAEGAEDTADDAGLRFGRPAERALRRQGLDQADWLLAKRLAVIDHLRDVALDNGNLELLNKADELEALARRQHDRRTGVLEPQGIGIGLFRTSNDPDPAPEPPADDPLPETPVQDPTPVSPTEDPTPEPPTDDPLPVPPAEVPAPDALFDGTF